MLFAENMTMGGKGLGESGENTSYMLVWGHVQFRGPWRCPRTDDKWAVESMDLDLREEMRVRDIYSGAPPMDSNQSWGGSCGGDCLERRSRERRGARTESGDRERGPRGSFLK